MLRRQPRTPILAALLTSVGFASQIEFVYNNGGYIAQTQNEQYFAVWDDIEPADTLQTFRKPPGELISAFDRHRWTL